MRNLLLILTSLLLASTACASSPTETGAGNQSDPTATATVPSVDEPTTGPTALVVPTAAPASQAQPTSTPTPAVQPTSSPTPTPAVQPTAGPQPTATARPIPTVAPTATPTAAPQPTATAVPPTPTPTATSGWVNPDCYVGPGAADEPVWWCGGKICIVGAPHYGCPTSPPTFPVVRVGCTVSDRDIVVNEVITLRATQSPAGLPIEFAFNHGDGTIDKTAVSRAYYRAPGTYSVSLLWQYRGGKGSESCGKVTVRAAGSPTPTPTPDTLQIGCTISPQRTVQVDEILTFTAFQNRPNVPVTYIFDHGDGTLDQTAQSSAYYAAAGFYEVRLRWAYGNQSGTTFCGTVTVTPSFNASDYVGGTLNAAEAKAAGQGLVTRVVRIDDEYFPGTTDYRLDRVNLEIDNQFVSAAYLG